VRTILFVIPGLEYGGAARQLTLLAAHLPRERFRVCVAVLGGGAPWADVLRAAGVRVEVLGWKRPLDARPFLALRRLIRAERPDVVHVWGMTALAAVVLTGSRPPRRVVASAVLPPGRRPGWAGRWLARHVGAVVALGRAEAERYRRLGVAEGRVTVVNPAVGTPLGPTSDSLPEGMPTRGRILLGIGPIAAHKGFRDAVWTLDILHYLYEDLHLVLVGGGPDLGPVQDFARSVRAGTHVHFTGPRAELTPLLDRAEVVWVPSHVGRGVGAALEAMAAGKPVVAARLPELAEVVDDGVTGYLVPPADKAALARQTRLLLDDPAQRARLGEAGQRRAAEHFAVGQLVEGCTRLYGGGSPVAGAPGSS
jgi:glycosyltransferase involved in cell wall biosynthesis